MKVTIAKLGLPDRSAWEVLACEYNAFYQSEKSPEEYDLAWTRLVSNDGVHGLGASVNGRLVGIAHFLFHTSTWASTVCYLQDLYTSPSERGMGVARALISAVAEQAKAADATRFYWLTRENNAVARVLYERVAKHNGFIRYEYPLKSDA